LPADQRAKALFQAAIIARTNGMELIGTEVEPDWHVHDGNFEEGVTESARATNEAAKVLVASEDELQRAARHKTDPEARFHYRYQAASLAWEAAKLMPDNSDDTARVLWTAGSWLKNRDPQTADILLQGPRPPQSQDRPRDGGGPDQVVPATGRAGQPGPAQAVAPGLHTATRTARDIRRTTARLEGRRGGA
jgi:hypothetical protein